MTNKKIIDRSEFGCCQICGCIDTGNKGYYSEEIGQKIWACPECAEEMRKEEAMVPVLYCGASTTLYVLGKEEADGEKNQG